MIRLEMKNYNMISTEKPLKYQLYHQAKLISMNILLVKIHYHLTQQQIIKQAKFAYSPLGKAFKKQIKTIEDQGEKQVEALKDLKPKEQIKSIEGIFPKGYESVEIKNKINKIKEYEKKVNRNNMIHYSCKKPFDFKTIKTLRSFGENINI